LYRIAVLAAWRYTKHETPTFGAYGEKTYGGRGDVLAMWPGMRVWLETAGPPAWKGAKDEKVNFFVCRLNPSYMVSGFLLCRQVLARLTPHEKFS
jgi:hypothetical protein